MKKLFLILPVLVIGFVSFAQKCKYKINEIDKFTGKCTKITKPEKVIGTFYTAGDFSVKKIDTSFYFIFDYELASYTNFAPYAINKGAALMFLLENGEKITLASEDNIKGTKRTIYGIPSVYVCNLSNVSYPLSRAQIDLFFKSKVQLIRFYRTEDNGKEDFIDNEIKKKNQDDIQDLIKCVL